MTKIRTLIADDHAIVRAGILQFLESADDIDVIAEAEDGEQAKVLILSKRPDVAVLDIQMPNATGIEVTRWSKIHAPEVGILILTAYNEDPYVIAVLQAGANGYVLKTADPTDIIQAVRDVHAGKSVLDPSVTGALMTQMFSEHQAPSVQVLTNREMEVLELVALGYTNKAIGKQLDISDRTVQGHLAHIFTKLEASNRTEAVMRAISLDWISQAARTKSDI